MELQDEAQLIFIEAIPEVDHMAPMGKASCTENLVFYIPECEERSVLATLIEKHGGLTTHIHECFTYQLHPLQVSFCLEGHPTDQDNPE